MGPFAVEKKKLKESGKLDKYGRPNDKTPKDWEKSHPDYTKVDTIMKVEDDPVKKYQESLKAGVKKEKKKKRKREESDPSLSSEPAKKKLKKEKKKKKKRK